MSRILNTKIAAAVVLTTLLGLTAFPLAAAGEAARPAATVGVWQQAWDFLFGGGLTSLSVSLPSGGLTAFHGEEGPCIDPDGRSFCRSTSLTGFRDHRVSRDFKQ